MVDGLSDMAKPDTAHEPPQKTEQEAPKKPVRSKRGKKRPRPPTNEDFVKVVPLKIQDDPTLPLQVCAKPCHDVLAPPSSSALLLCWQI